MKTHVQVDFPKAHLSMSREVDLPFAPFPGLTICTGGLCVTVERVSYDEGNPEEPPSLATFSTREWTEAEIESSLSQPEAWEMYKWF